MGALTLAVLVVLGFDEVDTGASPLLGERICVVHVHIDGSAADPLRCVVEESRSIRSIPTLPETARFDPIR